MRLRGRSPQVEQESVPRRRGARPRNVVEPVTGEASSMALAADTLETAMPPSTPPPPKTPSRMFETRSQAWREVGLLHEVSPRAARRARLQAFLLVPLFVAIVVVYSHRDAIFGKLSPEANTIAQIATVVALLILGWAIARDAGQ